MKKSFVLLSLALTLVSCNKETDDFIWQKSFGSSDGKMLLACIDNDGSKIWDTLLTAAFKIRRTELLYSGSGKLVAVGTAMADSVESGSSGILFVEFDTTGNIILKKETADNNFIAASNVTSDFSGNIFLPLT